MLLLVIQNIKYHFVPNFVLLAIWEKFEWDSHSWLPMLCQRKSFPKGPQGAFILFHLFFEVCIGRSNRRYPEPISLQKFLPTRMHSSRMRIARSSSHLGGSPPGRPGPGTPPDQAPLQTRHPPDQAPSRPGTLQTRHPPDQAPPWDQAPPQDQAHLPPGTRHPPRTRPPPGPGTPCEQNRRHL